jgi:hypothetical protein
VITKADLAEQLRDAVVECRATTREATSTAAAGGKPDYAADDAALSRVFELIHALELAAE